MSKSSNDVTNISKQVLDLYEKAWQLEKQTISLGIKRPKSEIFLSREILQLLIEIQDDYNNDGSNISTKSKQKKINLIEKYIKKLKTSQHIEMLTDFRNRSVILLLIAIPCKQTINCINYLLSINCDIHTIDNQGHNGCHIACEYTNYSALKLLHKHNVDVTLKDKSSEQLTPLHIALDILISSENNAHSINAHKYTKIVKLCTQYALLAGQDLVNDKLGDENGSSFNFRCGQSIMDVAMTNINVLSVLTDAYNHCRKRRKECGKTLLEHQLNESLVGLVWSFMYSPLPKLKLNAKLKKAKKRLQKERIQRRESLRNSIKLKRSRTVSSTKLKSKKCLKKKKKVSKKKRIDK
eukprot:119103_1